MSQYFTISPTLPLNRLEQLIYSEDRVATYLAQEGHGTSEQTQHFIKTLFAQMDLEMSFDKTIHQKFKKYDDFLTEFTRYQERAYGSSSAYSILSNREYAQVHAKDQLLKLQTVMVELGASDDELNQLNLFGDTSVDNIRELYKAYCAMDKAAIAAKSSDVLTYPVQSDLKTADDHKVKFYKLLIDSMGLTFYHSQPEPNSSSGFNTFSHLSLTQFLTRSLTTVLPNDVSNPFVGLFQEQERSIRDKTTSAWLTNWVTPSNLPFLFFFIETGKLKYKEMSFFASLSFLLDSIPSTGFDSSKCNDIFIEVLTYVMDLSAEITIELRDSKTPSSHKYYYYRSYTRDASWSLLPKLSYDQLVKLQGTASRKVNLLGETSFLSLILTKFVPANFTSLRNNQDVGVVSPYTISPSSVSGSADKKYIIGQHYPTRHVADTPIIINSESDLSKYRSIIPSFLLTTMDLYKQMLSILKSAISGASESAQVEGYYYTAMASFLQYTASYNLWRFDIFDSDFIPTKLRWSSSNYGGITNWFNSSIPCTQSNLPPQIFPLEGGFDTLIDKYISQYYLQPEVTSWDQSQVYKKCVTESYLKEHFYQAKNSQSQVVIDISCDQSSVYSNTVAVKDLKSMSDELSQVTRPQQQTNKTPTISTPIITAFDLKEYYPQQYTKVGQHIEGLKGKVSEERFLTYGKAYGASLKWSDSFKQLKNTFNVDTDGNIRAAITAVGVKSITVNIYHIDIFLYYQSQLTKGQNVSRSDGNSVDLDPNYDLEGIVPHYTTQVDLESLLTKHKVDRNYFDINLCMDNIPARGIFMLEVLNGQEGIRCCVRKGQFSAIQKQINAGTLLLLLNEAGNIVQNPRVYMGIDVFKPKGSDDNQTVVAKAKETIAQGLVPQHLTDADIQSNFIFIPSYDTTKTVLLTDDEQSFASCLQIQPITNTFSLECDWFTSVEALTQNISPTNDTNETNVVNINSREYSLRTGPGGIIGGGNMGAELILKPTLKKNGNKIVELENCTIVRSALRISAELESGVIITDSIDQFNLLPQPEGGVDSAETTVPQQEILHTFNVPNNLSKLSFDLTLVIEFEGKEFPLSSQYVTTIATIHKTPVASGMVFLRRVNGLYMAYTLDKTGSPLPFTGLNFSYTSDRLKSPTSYNLWTDLNGCVELGALIGVNMIKLSTVNNQYSFIRGSFTYNITPYHTTIWPSALSVIVDDSDVGITPKDLKGRSQDGVMAQIALPLPTNTTFNLNLATLLCTTNSASPKLNSDLSTIAIDSTSQQALYPFERGTLVDDKVQNIILNDFIRKYGGLTLIEKSSFTTIRRFSPDLIFATPTSVEVYGLRPNREYTLKYNWDGQEYMVDISTYRNPKTKIDSATAVAAAAAAATSTPSQRLSFGTVLAPQLYFDRTLTCILDYLVCRGKIVLVKDLSQQAIIRHINYQPQTETLELSLRNFSKETTKVVVFASNLITTPTDLLNLYYNSHIAQLSSVVDGIGNSIIQTGKAKNIDFVSGTSISGEREYVMHRRELVKSITQVGIMLPQPSLLLNKRLVRNTEAILDQAKSKAVKGNVERKEKEDYSEREICVPSSAREYKKRSQISATNYRGGYYSSGSDPHQQVVFDNQYNSFDIIKYKSSILLNLSPDENGQVIIKRNGLNKYTTLTIIAYETCQAVTNSFGFNSVQIDIPQTTIRAPLPTDLATRTTLPPAIQPSFVTDTAFALTLQPTKQYTEEHRAGVIKPSQQLSLSPTTTATATAAQQSSTIIGPNSTVELEILTSHQDLYALLQSLIQTAPTTSPLLPRRQYRGDVSEVNTVLQKYHFLPEWTTLPESQKLTNLDRYACHELHLFIFFQDRSFFESVVRLHLCNKLKKDIVDLWLLSQAIAVTPFTQSSTNSTAIRIANAIKNESRLTLRQHGAELQKYNIFEQILILSVVDVSGLQSFAKQVKLDSTLNPSLERDNLSWVTIFESCLRRTMLKLNTTLPEKVEDDEEEDNNQQNKQNKDKKMADSESDDDSYDDDADGEVQEEEEAEGYGRGIPQIQPIQHALRSRRCAPAPQEMERCAPPPPPPCSAPTSMCMSESMAPARDMLMPMKASISMRRQSPMGAAITGARGKGGASLDSLAQSYEKAEKPSSIPSYKPLEKTGEYEERTWYIDSKYDAQNYTLPTTTIVQWSSFWVDFALHLSTPSLFSIDNDFSSEVGSNHAFASCAVLDLVNAGSNEYLLCLAVSQLSPQVIAKQSVIGTIKGAELINSSPDVQSQWNIISNMTNTTQSIANVIGSLSKGAQFRFVKQVMPQYPILILHKQVQQLSGGDAKKDDATTTTTASSSTTSNNHSKSLSANHYYIDVFESIQKSRQIYVEPSTLFKRRAYMCKTVISNQSPEPIKTKVLVTIPDGSTSLSWTPPGHSSSSNLTHLNYLQSRTIYCTIPSYSSYVIQYSFLLGNRDNYTHYGATITSTNSAISQLYCFVPSLSLQCTEYKTIINRRDAITIAREASEDELCEYIADYYHLNSGSDDLATASGDVDDRFKFYLHYIFFRFNNEAIALSSRWALYMRVYNIVRGFVATRTTTAECRDFMAYTVYFLRQNASQNQTKLTNPTLAKSQPPTFFDKFTVSPSDCINIAQALSNTFQRGLTGGQFKFSWKSWQHLEYLPLVAARIHNASIGTDAKTGTNTQHIGGGSDNSKTKDIFIPDKQLKEQYIRTLEYSLVHSSSVANVPSTQLLSLIYYAVILNQNVRVVSLLQSLLNTLSKQYKAKSTRTSTTMSDDDDDDTNNAAALPITTCVQLAYLLVYIDVSTYGQLQSTLTQDQLDIISVIFSNSKIATLQSPTQHQKSYGLSLLLAQTYEKYPIKQWKLLFLQTLQYLKEGQVIVTAPVAAVVADTTTITMSDEPSTKTEDETPIITDKDFDVNVAGMSSLQRDLRQDIGAKSTPSLTLRTQQQLDSTQVIVNFSNLSPRDDSLVFEIHYMDSELLLSHKPFMTSTANTTTNTKSSNSTNASTSNDQITRPHLSIRVPLPPHTVNQPGLHSLTIPIPAHLSKEAQLTLRAPYSHLSSTAPLLHSSFTVQVLAKQGIVAVLDAATNKPVSGVYIKSYTSIGDASSSEGKFLCDKYTDIRGKASFVDASNNKTSNSNQQFALIVSHPKFGTTVVYTKGPQM